MTTIPLKPPHFPGRRSLSRPKHLSPVLSSFSVQLELILSIVEEVNKKTGEAECQFYRRGLAYMEESQRIPEIQLSRFLYCQGELKNNKGQVLLLLFLSSLNSLSQFKVFATKRILNAIEGGNLEANKRSALLNRGLLA